MYTQIRKVFFLLFVPAIFGCKIKNQTLPETSLEEKNNDTQILASYNNEKASNEVSDTRKYDSAGHLVYEKNSYESETWYEYDKSGNIIHKKIASEYSNEETWYEYDSSGNIIHEKHANGIEWWSGISGWLTYRRDNSGNEIWYDRKDYTLGRLYAHITEDEYFEKEHSFSMKKVGDSYFCLDGTNWLFSHAPITDETGGVWKDSSGTVFYEYDPFLTQDGVYNCGDKVENAKMGWFDENGRLIYTDNMEEFVYDDSGRLVCIFQIDNDLHKLSDPLPAIQSAEMEPYPIYFEYFPNGKIKKMHHYGSRRGISRVKEWDFEGNLVHDYWAAYRLDHGYNEYFAKYKNGKLIRFLEPILHITGEVQDYFLLFDLEYNNSGQISSIKLNVLDINIDYPLNDKNILTLKNDNVKILGDPPLSYEWKYKYDANGKRIVNNDPFFPPEELIRDDHFESLRSIFDEIEDSLKGTGDGPNPWRYMP